MNTFDIPADEIPVFYRGYGAMLQGKPFKNQLHDSLKETVLFLESIPEEKWDHAYAPGKWTMRQLVLHVLDAERIFSYRALRFSRNDSTELPGFDEDMYVPNSGATGRSKASLIAEFKTVRSATLSLFDNLTPEMLLRKGTANGNTISVRAIGLSIAGHEMHHWKILKERYL